MNGPTTPASEWCLRRARSSGARHPGDALGLGSGDKRIVLGLDMVIDDEYPCHHITIPVAEWLRASESIPVHGGTGVEDPIQSRCLMVWWVYGWLAHNIEYILREGIEAMKPKKGRRA